MFSVFFFLSFLRNEITQKHILSVHFENIYPSSKIIAYIQIWAYETFAWISFTWQIG